MADKEFITKDGRVWDALPGVRCPCLIMNGDRDVLVPHENAVGGWLAVCLQGRGKPACAAASPSGGAGCADAAQD